MKYIVHVEETVSQDFILEAESEEEALKLAREKYEKGELVLEPGELLDTSITVSDSTL